MIPFSAFRFSAGQFPVTMQWLQLSGNDAESFLQSQTTNDLRLLHEGQFSFHAFTDRTGKIEAHFVVLRLEGLNIFVAPGLLPAVRERFQKYVISEDVSVSYREEKTLHFALGPKVKYENCWIGNLRNESMAIFESAQVEIEMRNRQEGMEYFMWQGWPPLHEPFRVGELINQTILFDTAVDLRKGCFPGQETISKIHNNRGAAWSPVLLESLQGEFKPELNIEGKLVAKTVATGQFDEKKWGLAEVLRDVRVLGLELSPLEGGRFKIHPFPLFAVEPEGKARELFHLGALSFQRGLENEALSLWERSIDLNPTYADAYEAIGVLLGRTGEDEKAIEWMQRLLTICPESTMAHTNLSLSLMRLGKIEEAEYHKSQATISTFAQFGKEANQKKIASEQEKKSAKEREAREEMFRQVLEIDPEDALANYGLGSIALERSDFSLAHSYFDKVLRSDNRYTVAYLGLGKSLLGMGKKSEARLVLEQGIKVAAKNGDMMPANEMQGLIAEIY